jgi:dipeptidyl aminopeptidase/acylaminoacyl peptidase
MHLTRRMMMAAMASCTVLPAFSPARAAEPDFPIPETLPLDRTDYAEARRKFTTHLLQKGPAPDDQHPLGTPPESRRITYPGGPDGSIPLVAWISPYQETGKPKPAVLFLHGGNATGDGHWLLMKPYVEAGFVVMLPSFRGENGQEGYFSGFYDETSDALAAATYLENLPGIDKDRLFIAGHSNGGTLSILAGMDRKFRAAVPISAGVSAWRFFARWEQDIRFDRTDPQEFLMRSSACFAPSLKCPTFLLRGSEEQPFDKDHQLLIDRVKAAGGKISTKILPGTHTGVVPGAVHESIRFFNQFMA